MSRTTGSDSGVGKLRPGGRINRPSKLEKIIINFLFCFDSLLEFTSRQGTLDTSSFVEAYLCCIHMGSKDLA